MCQTKPLMLKHRLQLTRNFNRLLRRSSSIQKILLKTSKTWYLTVKPGNGLRRLSSLRWRFSLTRCKTWRSLQLNRSKSTQTLQIRFWNLGRRPARSLNWSRCFLNSSLSTWTTKHLWIRITWSRFRIRGARWNNTLTSKITCLLRKYTVTMR